MSVRGNVNLSFKKNEPLLSIDDIISDPAAIMADLAFNQPPIR